MTHRDDVAAAAAAQQGLVEEYDAAVKERDDLGTALVKAQDELAATKAALAACQAGTGSGAPITTDVPSGWRVTITENFDISCADKAAFDATYPSRGIKRYPDHYPDTRTNQGKTDGGYYNAPIRVTGGVLKIEMDVVNGKARVGAIVPVPTATGTWGDSPGVIVEERSRFTLDPGFKAAHLLWPQSNKSNPDGEIDYPEFNGPAGPVSAFIHYQNPTTSGEQKAIGTTIDPRQWHTYRTVWKMGQSVAFYCDGALISPTWTARVPATPMHIVLQNETILGTGTVGPGASAKGLVETDWIRVMVPA